MFIPRFLQGTADLLLSGNTHGRNLVVIQLSGGNDGLNTVVPITNDIYYNLRPSIGLNGKDILKISDDWGFNAALGGFRTLYDQGLMTVVHGVGYPDPNRSHFRSTDVWQTGSAGKELLQTGWIGRYLDQLKGAQPYHALESNETLSRVLKGERESGLAIDGLKQFLKGVEDPFVKAVHAHSHATEHHHDQVAYMHNTLTRTVQSAEYLKAHQPIQSTAASYPSNPLAKQLKDIAGFIGAGADTRVYYAGLKGFDTHANQKGAQGRLLGQLGDTLNTFVQDVKARGRLDTTMVMVFSEFGRRVKQNAARGTDHGTAGPVFLIGGNLHQPGMIGTAPSLSDLDQGDLKYTTDYRSIYAGILRDHMGADYKKIVDPKVRVLPVAKMG